MKKEFVFFDGICNFCNSSVNFIIDRDVNDRFLFAPLQSEEARAKISEAGHQPDQLPDSIVLLKEGVIYTKSTAALHIASRLSGLWPALRIFLVVPSRIRDGIYDSIARNRYRWFGKRDTCRMPEPGVKEKFLAMSFQ